METKFQNLEVDGWKAQAMLAFFCEKENFPTENQLLDQICPWLAVAPALRDFKAKKGDICVFHGHPDLPVPRVVAIGLGSRAALKPETIWTGVAEAARTCRNLGLESLLLPEPFLAGFPGGRERLLEDCARSLHLGLYRFEKFKTDKKELPANPAWLAIGLNNDSPPDAMEAVMRGESGAKAVILARDLDNMPGNRLYPEALALRASECAQEHGFGCVILDEEALLKAGLGCLLAVGQGSTHPPRLIVLEHAAAGHENDKPLILVGKGITFDSGGLCLKPAANMNRMKCDMSGAASALAVIDAAARENTPHRIISILACAENMPDGGAYRPGDILTCANGETVEVVNTDAEGRLALCDALVYAQKNWTPLAIIDIATLTGACAVALGEGLAGLFCDDANLSERIRAYGAACGENYWQLPLWNAYEDKLKSNVADICHTATREGGAIMAALFLRHFIHPGELWAHLDIAGVDWTSKSTPTCPEGASGFGTLTLLALARGGLA